MLGDIVCVSRMAQNREMIEPSENEPVSIEDGYGGMPIDALRKQEEYV